MTDAPERIFAAPPWDDPAWTSGAGEWDVSEDWAADGIVEYIRADLVQRMVDEAVEKKRERLATVLETQFTFTDADKAEGVSWVSDIGKYIAAAIRKGER